MELHYAAPNYLKSLFLYKAAVGAMTRKKEMIAVPTCSHLFPFLHFFTLFVFCLNIGGDLSTHLCTVEIIKIILNKPYEGIRFFDVGVLLHFLRS